LQRNALYRTNALKTRETAFYPHSAPASSKKFISYFPM
jgi:hypothetical protein